MWHIPCSQYAECTDTYTQYKDVKFEHYITCPGGSEIISDTATLLAFAPRSLQLLV